MKTKFDFNPITKKFDLVGHVPQLNYDPSNPKAEDAWVLKRQTGIGRLSNPWLFLVMFNDGTEEITTRYDLSFRTRQGTTVRVLMEVDDPHLDPSSNILTEDGDNLVTEDGEHIVEE